MKKDYLHKSICHENGSFGVHSFQPYPSITQDRYTGTADFIYIKGTWSVHSFKGDYLSIP